MEDKSWLVVTGRLCGQAECGQGRGGAGKVAPLPVVSRPVMEEPEGRDRGRAEATGGLDSGGPGAPSQHAACDLGSPSGPTDQ